MKIAQNTKINLVVKKTYAFCNHFIVSAVCSLTIIGREKVTGENPNNFI
tara:strand:- start:479 stop:625 length:147 start_codon:yes stop_codon:yes gene_type:complete